LRFLHSPHWKVMISRILLASLYLTYFNASLL
jgi:hypothetical protein